MALLLPFRGKRPRIAPDAFLAPTAVLIGDVVVESEASVWFGAVLRGDNPEHGIIVGPRVSVQDNCVIHVGDWMPTVIGADVTVGHGAKLESCKIGDGTMIGMNAVILPNVVIGEECLMKRGGRRAGRDTETAGGHCPGMAPARQRALREARAGVPG
jgi:carbonic anhydrase/acetyltransferase-like protein (isoleucine patch superfamily)